jgi:hypothetical protein
LPIYQPLYVFPDKREVSAKAEPIIAGSCLIYVFCLIEDYQVSIPLFAQTDAALRGNLPYHNSATKRSASIGMNKKFKCKSPNPL